MGDWVTVRKAAILYTRIQTNIHCLLRELSGPRPLCRGADIVSKPFVWDLKMYTVCRPESIENPQRVSGRVILGVEDDLQSVPFFLTPALLPSLGTRLPRPKC